MISTKDRRNSGKYTPTTDISKKELLANNIEIPAEYDDWNNYRDGFRDWYRDGKMIKNSYKRKYHKYHSENDIKRTALNNKQKRLLKIRAARKNKKI